MRISEAGRHSSEGRAAGALFIARALISPVEATVGTRQRLYLGEIPMKVALVLTSAIAFCIGAFAFLFLGLQFESSPLTALQGILLSVTAITFGGLAWMNAHELSVCEQLDQALGQTCRPSWRIQRGKYIHLLITPRRVMEVVAMLMFYAGIVIAGALLLSKKPVTSPVHALMYGGMFLALGVIALMESRRSHDED